MGAWERGRVGAWESLGVRAGGGGRVQYLTPRTTFAASVVISCVLSVHTVS